MNETRWPSLVATTHSNTHSTLCLSLAPLPYNSFIMKITSVVLVLLSVVAVSQVTALPSSQGHRIEIWADDVIPDNVKAEVKGAFQTYIDSLDQLSRDVLSNEVKTFVNMDPEERRKSLGSDEKYQVGIMIFTATGIMLDT